MKTRIEKYFKIKENNSHIQTEIFSGLTAFFTMVYLLFLVPNTLMGAFPEAFNEAWEAMYCITDLQQMKCLFPLQ